MFDGNNKLIVNNKKKIQDITGPHLNNFYLMCEEQILQDDCVMMDKYQIYDKSIIGFFCKLRAIEIFVKSINDKMVTIYINNYETIANLKKTFQDKTEINTNDQILTFNSEILEDDKTIDECQIIDKSIINIISRLIGGIQIFAKTMDGKTVAIQIIKNETIADIKKKIQEKIGLAPDEQKLVFQGGILEDDKMVNECGIAERSVINVVARLRNGIQIFAKTLDGKIVPIEIIKNETIADLKKKIQEKIGLATDEQTLVYNDGILEDDKMVDEYGIVERSVIKVLNRLRGDIIIYAKTMDGKTVPIEINKNERIANIKKKIQQKIGLAPEEQKIFFLGGILEDDKMADEYQMAEKSVINVVARLIILMQIFVITNCDEMVAIETNIYETISTIKKKIQAKTGINTNDKILIFNCGILEDDKTINECQIIDNSIINMANLIKEIEIFAITKDGKIISINVNKNKTIADIKKKIQEKTAQHPNNQKLTFQNEILQDDNITISECKLIDKSIINIDKWNIEEIEIKIVLDGVAQPIKIWTNDKIIHLKEKIQLTTKVHQDEQRLIYRCKPLTDDNKSIDQCQICDQSTIIVFNLCRD